MQFLQLDSDPFRSNPPSAEQSKCRGLLDPCVGLESVKMLHLTSFLCVFALRAILRVELCVSLYLCGCVFLGFISGLSELNCH